MIDILRITSGLRLESNGVWCSEGTSEISYPDKGNESSFAIEDESFWYQHRNNCIIALIRSYPPKDNGTIFDIGGGNGYVSHAIAKGGYDVVLVEPGLTGALNAKSRGIDNIICSTLEQARFSPESLQAVGLFDVIEHIEDDLDFLKTLNKLLVDGGRLYVTVPSYSFLWSNEDKEAGHYRRYTIREISEKLVSAGFNVEFSTYIFRLLPLPIFLLRTLPSKFGLHKGTSTKRRTRDHTTNNNILKTALDMILSSEIESIKKGAPIRFGGSCLLTASRS